MPWRRVSLERRLAMLPVADAPLTRQVAIYWNRHQVPFIEAQTDTDLATALGMIHAHLRLGQMELMRRLSQGRLSEILGAFGVDMDRFARTFEVGRATPGILAMMPEETRLWLESFASGINHYLAHSTELPPEFRLLGIVTLGRLVAADVNWLVWIRLLRFRHEKNWPALWPKLLRHDTFSLGASQNWDSLASANAMLQALRSGSNSLAVSGAKSATSASLIANDPHLGIMLPNPWLLAGMKSPSHHAIGCMLPGIPFVAFGRNPWLAWGGANLHAASSDLVAVPPDAPIRVRKEVIAVKGEPERVIEVPESDWGPLIGDLNAFRAAKGERLAVRWMGHRPSDEFTAMLRVGTARNWDEFRAALSGYALPGLQFNVADVSGRVGGVTAVHVPRRGTQSQQDIAVEPNNGWDEILGSSKLPATCDPPSGFVAAANARPEDEQALFGYFFSPPDRIHRLNELMQSRERISLDDLMALQRDVHLKRSLAERDLLLVWLDGIPPPIEKEAQRLSQALRDWDGNYDAESEAALVLELISYHLSRRLVPREMREAYDAAWGTRALVWQDFIAADQNARSRALGEALGDAIKDMNSGRTWGSQHRVRLLHGFGRLPLIGRAYRFADLPASGNSETLMKTAHGMTNRRHGAAYGSVARHISDLSDPDRNYFCLLGGQDGWLGSTNFADQVSLWQRGEYLTLPLQPETARATFLHRTQLDPPAP